jgi:hypothetical protein
MAERALLLRIVRLLSPLISLSLNIRARLPGGQQARFVLLPKWCARAVEAGKLTLATSHAQELLKLAGQYPDDWNHGNATHHGHLTLGRIALRNGNIVTARAELIAAAQTTGSPQLCSFGPNMRLAQDLLRSGDRDVVLGYLELCRHFWKTGAARLATWTEDIRQDREPDFGPNLRY